LDGKSIKNKIDRVIIDGFRGDGINFNGRDCQNNEIALKGLSNMYAKKKSYYLK